MVSEIWLLFWLGQFQSVYRTIVRWCMYWKETIIFLAFFDRESFTFHFHKISHLIFSGQPWNQIQLAYFYLSEANYFVHFIVEHPVGMYVFEYE